MNTRATPTRRRRFNGLERGGPVLARFWLVFGGRSVVRPTAEDVFHPATGPWYLCWSGPAYETVAPAKAGFYGALSVALGAGLATAI